MVDDMRRSDEGKKRSVMARLSDERSKTSRDRISVSSGRGGTSKDR